VIILPFEPFFSIYEFIYFHVEFFVVFISCTRTWLIMDQFNLAMNTLRIVWPNCYEVNVDFINKHNLM